MLVFDPRKRITAGEALSHPYLAPYHDPDDEPIADSLFDWSFTEVELGLEQWKVAMYNEIMAFYGGDPAADGQGDGAEQVSVAAEDQNGNAGVHVDFGQ